ncbi:shikimate dehydrogenase family protein [Paenirhodobacter populi]|uniref:shikimate dehydrogenase (NADP(+)) n=1 Tax=Paenirhodobacter populi TaxID=2306993 RepID=A0A443JC17_9RHOB|nr:shikimate dehydrogenase [Sinirhodobacter populi]RWR18099.1 shikimate dehydrogenase [Sinirhodobacter populi]
MAAEENPATITGRTRVLGIFADPVGHVKAPPLINEIARRRGQDAVMVPFHIAPEDLSAIFDTLRKVKSFDGGIVTVPHKNAALDLCDRISDRARLVGAVNVIRRMPDGRIHGDALDGIGFLAGLKAAGHEVAGRRVYLAGAGGAAKAIAEAFAAEGVAQLTIYNRTMERAAELCDRLASVYPSVDFRVGTENPENHDIAVNGTSLGLRDGDALPFDVSGLSTGMVVAEVVMEPEITPLLAAARGIGCAIHPGKPMLEYQTELMSDFFGL